MLTRPIILAALLFTTTASMQAAAADTYRLGNRVITVGDSIATLHQVAGKPDRVVTLENDYGAAVAERWDYYLADGQLVSFRVSGGRVTEITGN